MKRSELKGLHQKLEEVSNLPGIKFAYAVSKNKQSIKTELSLLQEMATASENYLKYDNARIELCKKYAKKDEKGTPILKDNSYDIEDREAFDKEIEMLQKENASVMDERETQMKELETFLDEEIEFELHKIKLEDVPQDITSIQMDGIINIIEEG